MTAKAKYFTECQKQANEIIKLVGLSRFLDIVGTAIETERERIAEYGIDTGFGPDIHDYDDAVEAIRRLGK